MKNKYIYMMSQQKNVKLVRKIVRKQIERNK